MNISENMIISKPKTKNAMKSFLDVLISYVNSTFLIQLIYKLINLVVSCDGKDFDKYVCQAANNATYTSSSAVTDL